MLFQPWHFPKYKVEKGQADAFPALAFAKDEAKCQADAFPALALP